MLGVLLHAALIARHNTIMLDARLQYQDLVLSLGLICHPSGGPASVDSANLPVVPQPSDTLSECPICAGMTASAALLPAVQAEISARPRTSQRIAFVGGATAPRLPGTWPPSRGPPAPV